MAPEHVRLQRHDGHVLLRQPPRCASPGHDLRPVVDARPHRLPSEPRGRVRATRRPGGNDTTRVQQGPYDVLGVVRRPHRHRGGQQPMH